MAVFYYENTHWQCADATLLVPARLEFDIESDEIILRSATCPFTKKNLPEWMFAAFDVWREGHEGTIRAYQDEGIGLSVGAQRLRARVEELAA